MQRLRSQLLTSTGYDSAESSPNLRSQGNAQAIAADGKAIGTTTSQQVSKAVAEAALRTGEAISSAASQVSKVATDTS